MTEQERFFSVINGLTTGDRAALRREAGSMLRQANGRAITVFYACLPESVDRWQDDKWFAIACLRCLWDPDTEDGTPLEEIIGEQLKKENFSDSLKHRVAVLLDTKWDSDGYLLTKLSRLLKMIRQKTDRKTLDFSALLDDLLHWNDERQSVQRKWARAIFTTSQKNQKEE